MAGTVRREGGGEVGLADGMEIGIEGGDVGVLWGQVKSVTRVD